MEKFNYKEYLNSSKWKVVRRIALEFANYRCQVCNCTKKLQVHHRSYQNIGAETLSDVIVLCNSCHSLFHGLQKNQIEIESQQTITEKDNIIESDASVEILQKRADIRLDIEDILEIGKDYIGYKGVNRFAIRRLMESLGIDLQYHTKICYVLDNAEVEDYASQIDYILDKYLPYKQANSNDAVRIRAAD